jgi:hypothetical protein
MTTFHSRQSGDARRTRKNENADAFKITAQIPPSICAVMFMEHDKSDATIFKSRCSRTAVCYRLYTKQALPLNFVRFLRLANNSPMIQRSPARRSRNVRELSGKKSGEMSRSQNAPFPGNGRAVATAMPPDARTDDSQNNLPCAGLGRAMSAQQTMQHPAKYLAR